MLFPSEFDVIVVGGGHAGCEAAAAAGRLGAAVTLVDAMLPDLGGNLFNVAPVRDRVTVNLAPADVRKVGTALDLPIALGILAASGQLPAAALDPYEFAVFSRICSWTGVCVPAPWARHARRAGRPPASGSS